MKETDATGMMGERDECGIRSLSLMDWNPPRPGPESKVVSLLATED